MEPSITDLIVMHDTGLGVAVGLYKNDGDPIVRIGVGDESFCTSARSLYSMMRYYAHAGFKLEAPSTEMLDAQRYRYLRDLAGSHPGDLDGPMVCAGSGDLFDFLRGPEVDEAVDEAMAEFQHK